MNATYLRKTRIGKMSLPRSTHPTPTQSYKRKICHINSVPNMLFSSSLGLSRRGRLVQKLPFKNLLKYWFSGVLAQILLIQRILNCSKFKLDCVSYILLLFIVCSLLLHVQSMANLRFQNILNRKLVNIFISTPKTPNLLAHVRFD